MSEYFKIPTLIISAHPSLLLSHQNNFPS